MKTLLLMRHAKSSRKDPNLDDIERPLNNRGKKDASFMGGFLRSVDLIPQHILCSSAKRGIKTAQLVVSGCCTFSGQIEFFKELYKTDAANLIQSIHHVDNQFNCMLVVSHNPALENMIDLLCQELVTLPTASIARIALPLKKWQNLKATTKGELVNLWLPRDIK